ncbi:MAG: GGDEF domain-containing protein [Gammaproteobacteria bacterium]
MVRARTHELEERNRELGELAIRDSLTGLYNHSASIELLDQILNQSQRYGFPVATLMIDIDHFKRINDDHGHQVGDSVLESVAQALLDAVRSSDVVGRYGGEEFLIVMPHADAPAAREFSERLLRRIREIQVPGGDGKHVTVSVGIAVCHPHGQYLGAAEAVERADTALYRSKRNGRDRLTVDSVSLVAESAAPERRELPSAPA